MRRKNYMYGSCFVLTGWKPHMQYSVHFHQKILSGVTEWLESSNMEVSKVMRVPSKNSSIEPLDLFFFWGHLVQWAEMATILPRCYECGRSSFGRNRQVTPKTPAKHSPCCKVFPQICNHQDSSFSGAIHTSSLFIQIIRISFTTMILL